VLEYQKRRWNQRFERLFFSGRSPELTPNTLSTSHANG
jgi:hypothetical protein